MSRSISRRSVAYPRGRPDQPIEAKILPLPSVAAERQPKPIARFHAYYVLAGIPVHAIGERWHAKDAIGLPFPTYASPDDPSIACSLRLESGIEGVIIQSVSREEYLDRKRAIRETSRTRLAADPHRRGS